MSASEIDSPARLTGPGQVRDRRCPIDFAPRGSSALRSGPCAPRQEPALPWVARGVPPGRPLAGRVGPFGEPRRI